MSATAPPAAADCRLLAFDTSTEQMSLALVTPDGATGVDMAGGALASARLLPELQLLLQRAGCRLEELDAIAYGCGPGAFTGLRTACSVAQGLAYGLACPVLPVDSLMLVAETVRSALLEAGSDRVLVAQDARMDEIYAATYRWQPAGADAAGHWQVLETPALYALGALNDAWRDAGRMSGGAPPLLAGSALTVFGSRLEVAGAQHADPTRAGSRAAALARLACAAWQGGAARDAALALPLYLRDKVAQTTLERDAIRAAKAAA